MDCALALSSAAFPWPGARNDAGRGNAMHARHGLWILVLLTCALLGPGCAGLAESSATDEEDATSEDGLRDGPVESTKRIVCRGSTDDCVKQCHYAGVACFTRIEHPYKPEVGTGDLFACRTTDNKSCEYKYPNGEVCRFFKHPHTVLCTP